MFHGAVRWFSHRSHDHRQSSDLGEAARRKRDQPIGNLSRMFYAALQIVAKRLRQGGSFDQERGQKLSEQQFQFSNYYHAVATRMGSRYGSTSRNSSSFLRSMRSRGGRSRCLSEISTGASNVPRRATRANQRWSATGNWPILKQVTSAKGARGYRHDAGNTFRPSNASSSGSKRALGTQSTIRLGRRLATRRKCS